MARSKNTQDEGFWKRLAVTLGCIPVYIPPGADSFDALDKPRSKRRPSSVKSPQQASEKDSQRQRPPANPAKTRPLQIPASPFSAQTPSQRHANGLDNSPAPGAVGAGEYLHMCSSGLKSQSSNGAIRRDSSPHRDHREPHGQLPYSRSRPGPGASPLGASPAAGSGGIGRGRLQPGEDPLSYAAGKERRGSRLKDVTGADKGPATALARVAAAAIGSGPNGSGHTSLDGGSDASASSGTNSARDRPKGVPLKPELQQGDHGAVPVSPFQPQLGGRERADADGLGPRVDSAHLPVNYVSDYYHSDSEHAFADSSYGAAHIFGHAAAVEAAAQRAAGGTQAAPRDASAGGAGHSPGDAVRDTLNAAQARLRHNNSAPRRPSHLHIQVPRDAAELTGASSTPRTDSPTGAASSPAAAQGHAHGAAGDANAAHSPHAAALRQGSLPHGHADHHHHHQPHHPAQLQRFHSPHGHALPSFGSGNHLDSAGGSFNSGPQALAVAGRQGSVTYTAAGASSARGAAHDLAVAARQASVAMSTGSGRPDVGSARQGMVTRTGSVTAVGGLPLMSTVMLATRRFAAGAGAHGHHGQQQHRGGGGGDSGTGSRVASMTFGSGGSMVARGPYGGAHELAVHH